MSNKYEMSNINIIIMAFIASLVGTTLVLGASKILDKAPLDKEELVVGVVSIPTTNKKENYEQDLKEFLTSKLGNKIDIEIDVKEISGIPNQPLNTRINDLRNNIYEPIDKKKWDVAFALLPLSSLKAKENGYEFVAKMFWNASAENQPPGIFFVREDSLVKEFKDITDNQGKVYSPSDADDETKNFVEGLKELPACRNINFENEFPENKVLRKKPIIALGSPETQQSIFAFYIPLYHLYGSSFFADYKNSSCEILMKVLLGRADVGVGIPPLPFIKNAINKKLIREIPTRFESKVIPYSGVFLSPELSESDRRKLAQVLLEAPPELMEKLHYIDNNRTEPNYDDLRAINDRVDEIIDCAKWERNTPKEEVSNPVTLSKEKEECKSR